MELSEKQKNRLLKLAKIADEGEFGVVKELMELHEMCEEMEEEHQKAMEAVLSKAEEAVRIAQENLKKEGPPGKDGYTPQKGVDYFDGEPGKDYVLTSKDKKEIAEQIEVPIVEKVIERTEVIKEQPVVKEVAVGDTPEQIRDKLSSLKGEDRLDVSAIKGIKKGKDSTMYVSNSGGTGGRIVKSFDLYSQLNGSTKTFALPAFWRVISVHSSSFPFSFRPTVDYTTDASAMTLTFTSEINEATTLASGQTVTIIYAEA